MAKLLKLKDKIRTIKVKKDRIYQGDNLEIMKKMESRKIDLIYMDPPFCAQNVFKGKAFVSNSKKNLAQFNDNWGGGVHSYIKWLAPRLKQCHALLKDTGVLCLHLDYRSVHYAKVTLDEIFGENNFVNELIWCYKSGGASKKHFSKKHDTILVYSKSKQFTFNPQKEKSYNRGFKPYRFKGVKEYQDDLGWYTLVNRKDVLNIDMVGRTSKERLGYPTQKPLKLLDVLIESFTNKNDLVFDPFCGCGTTVSSAQNLKRNWLGIDISKESIKVIKHRMAKEHKLKIEVVNEETQTAKDILSLNPFDFERKIVELLGGIPNKKQVGDGGIDGKLEDFTPIQVKKSYSIGRPVLDSFYKHIRNGNGKGIIVAHSFCKTIKEEVNKLKIKEGLEVLLIETKDLLRENFEDKKAVA